METYLIHANADDPDYLQAQKSHCHHWLMAYVADAAVGEATGMHHLEWTQRIFPSAHYTLGVWDNQIIRQKESCPVFYK